MNKARAVLFDYDGVLVDSMEEMYVAWSKAISFYKEIKIDKNFFYRLEGRPAKNMAKYLFSKYNLGSGLIENVIKKKEEYFFRITKNKVNKGAIEIIEYLKSKNILVGLVTGAPLSRIERVLSPSIFKKFDAMVTSDDIKHGKPHPEPYLKAIKKLNVKKQHSIVVENAPLGIQSALKAGLFCFAIESTLQRKHLANAHKVFKNFESMVIYFKSRF